MKKITETGYNPVVVVNGDNDLDLDRILIDKRKVYDKVIVDEQYRNYYSFTDKSDVRFNKLQKKSTIKVPRWMAGLEDFDD